MNGMEWNRNGWSSFLIKIRITWLKFKEKFTKLAISLTHDLTWTRFPTLIMTQVTVYRNFHVVFWKCNTCPFREELACIVMKGFLTFHFLLKVSSMDPLMMTNDMIDALEVSKVFWMLDLWGWKMRVGRRLNALVARGVITFSFDTCHPTSRSFIWTSNLEVSWDNYRYKKIADFNYKDAMIYS